MPEQITFEDLQAQVLDPSNDIHTLRQYFTGSAGDSSPFDPRVTINRDLVLMSEHEAELENAMRWANAWSRRRREKRFQKRLRDNDVRPVLVSEGDSWFQFPLMLDDAVDHLFHKYSIRSFGAAGATAGQMVAKAEYVPALHELAGRVRAFLFSGAGNDVIGQDESGRPNIEKLVLDFRGQTNPADLIDEDAVGRVLSVLRGHYDTMLGQVRAIPGLSRLPIVIHGYDYAIPGSRRDPRNPVWAKPDQWLARPLTKKQITDPDLQRGVIARLIDRLYDELYDFARSDPHVRLADLRGTLPQVSDWADEIHATDGGFGNVANKLRVAIEADGDLESAPAATPHIVTGGGGERIAGARDATIVIDPGHGGDSMVGGSSANNAVAPGGTREKDLTLAVGLALRDILKRQGLRVLMTRASDRNLSLSQRASLAQDNAAEVFVSIHFNGWHTPDVQGTETFYHEAAKAPSKLLARQVQDALLRITGYRDRGVKTARYGVLRPDRHDARTAACLAEISFITDPAEEARLLGGADPGDTGTALDSDYISALAGALAEAINHYLGDAEGAVVSASAPVFETAMEDAFEDGFSLNAALDRDPTLVGTPLSRQPGLIDRPPPPYQALAFPGIHDPKKFLRRWRTYRRQSRGVSVGFEATIGGIDNSLPVSFLSEGHRLSRAIAKVEASGVNHERRIGDWDGTGFLVAPDILLTNHHVLNSVEVARSARVQFDYFLSPDGTPSYGERFELDPDALFITSPAYGGLDYTFVKVKGRPGDRFGHVPMRRASFTIAEDERANIIHHPNGQPKRVSIQDNKSAGFSEILLWYTSDTLHGSSGAPVFDNTWRLIALHHASTENHNAGGAARVLNEGIKISAIAVDLDTRLYDPDEGPAARSVLKHIAGSDSLTGYFGAAGRRQDPASPFETVVDAYRGGVQDIDVAFWNLEWFNRRYQERAGQVARIIADLNLDIWAFAETSPQATEELVEVLEREFGHKFEFLASEPDASSGKQTTTVMWNPLTVTGKAMSWPDEIESLLRADSRDELDLDFEAVEGKIFNRYPGWFRFSARGREDTGCAPFDFNLVPLHLKAMAEGARRRRLASEVLAASVQRMIDHYNADHDWVLLGDINAPLATGQFSALTDGGFGALGAADEQAGAFTYLKSPKSLIDNIFLSPSLAETYGADDFFIYAGDETIPDFVRSVSDHRIVMARLALSDHMPPTRQPQGVVSGSTSDAGRQARLDSLLRDLDRETIARLLEILKELAPPPDE